MNRNIWIGLLALPVLSGCLGRLPLLGVTSDGSYKRMLVSERVYKKHISQAIETFHESLPQTLNHSNSWELKKLRMSIGLKAEGGIGPYKVGANPRIRITFKKVSGDRS